MKCEEVWCCDEVWRRCVVEVKEEWCCEEVEGGCVYEEMEGRRCGVLSDESCVSLYMSINQLPCLQ